MDTVIRLTLRWMETPWSKWTISYRLPRQYTQSTTGGSQADIMRRIALASSVMSYMEQVWRDKHLSLSTKIWVHEILVLPVLLYACETWAVLAADERRLKAFHMKCQSQTSKIRWQDHTMNCKVAARTGLGLVSDLIKRHRNSLFGHIKGFPKIRQHTKHSAVMLTWLSAILPSTAGSVVRVIWTNDGSTSILLFYLRVFWKINFGGGKNTDNYNWQNLWHFRDTYILHALCHYNPKKPPSVLSSLCE